MKITQRFNAGIRTSKIFESVRTKETLCRPWRDFSRWEIRCPALKRWAIIKARVTTGLKDGGNEMRSKPEHESFRSRCVSNLVSVLCPNQFVTKAEPAAQLLRRLIDRSRPAPAGEGTLHVGKLCVLSQNEERDGSL